MQFRLSGLIPTPVQYLLKWQQAASLFRSGDMLQVICPLHEFV